MEAVTVRRLAKRRSDSAAECGGRRRVRGRPPTCHGRWPGRIRAKHPLPSPTAQHGPSRMRPIARRM